MINELQSAKESFQGVQNLIREFDIKLVNLARNRRKQ